MKIWVAPLEVFEERYTSQWFSWFKEEFDKLKVKYEFVVGDILTNEIEVGSFLDVYNTNYYKAGQLMKLIEKIRNKEIKSGDVIFFFDLWSPGLEMLQYIRQGAGIDFKICGILHAGTYDCQDFLFKKGMKDWGEHLENSWFNFVDAIFVATDFHRRLIIDNRLVDTKKIHVTGLPFYFDTYPKISEMKKDIVVFPHRLDEEKQPFLFDIIKEQFSVDFPNWQFIKSKEYIKHFPKNMRKAVYYSLLNISKISVSFALQETWGIAMQESLFYGCLPLVPNSLSYYEMYFAVFQYSSTEEFTKKLKDFMTPSKNYLFEDKAKENAIKLKSQGIKAIPNMLEIMRRL